MLGGSESLSHPTPSPTAFKPRAFAVLVGTGFAVFLVDHLTKWWVVAGLPLNGQWPGPSAPVAIHHVENSGAAFSLFPNEQWVFLLAAAAVCLYILVAGHRHGTSTYRQTVLGAILGGAASNAVDRLVQGRVVDFIDLRDWPVFNLADCAIVIAMILVVTTFRDRPVAAPDATP